jgi:hypothetical protein
MISINTKKMKWKQGKHLLSSKFLCSVFALAKTILVNRKKEVNENSVLDSGGCITIGDEREGLTTSS